jgi:cytochrome c oxidase cbb3-type subunit 2
MPAYPWLFSNELNLEVTPRKLRALQRIGVPYSEEDIANATEGLEGVTEAQALVAFLQHLGTLITERR